MLLPLFVLGTVTSLIGIVRAAQQGFIISSRTRTEGTLLRIETVTDFGLSDSTQRLIVRYKDTQGKRMECAGRARVTLGWYTLGQTLPVYLSTNPKNPPLIGDFQELWLLPFSLCGLGLLCLSLAYIL